MVARFVARLHSARLAARFIARLDPPWLVATRLRPRLDAAWLRPRLHDPGFYAPRLVGTHARLDARLIGGW